MIEINPLVLTKNKDLICLDAKINFDDNAMYRRPEILKLRDLNEEEPAETVTFRQLALMGRAQSSRGHEATAAGLSSCKARVCAMYICTNVYVYVGFLLFDVVFYYLMLSVAIHSPYLLLFVAISK